MSQPEDWPQAEYLCMYLSMLYFLWGQEEIVINHEGFSLLQQWDPSCRHMNYVPPSHMHSHTH